MGKYTYTLRGTLFCPVATLWKNDEMETEFAPRRS